MKNYTIHITVFFLFLSLSSCSKKNVEPNIAIYEQQTKSIEHLLVCLDQQFSMTSDQENFKLSQANTLVGLINVTNGQLQIVNDQFRMILDEEQRAELNKMSKRLLTVVKNLQIRFKALSL